MFNAINTILKPIKNKILNLVVLGIVKAINDNQDFQLISIQNSDGISKNIERIQNYGLTSNPPLNSGSILLSQNGDIDNGIIICVDGGKYRLKGLESGEVALYSMFNNSHILLKNDGSINVNSEKANIGLSNLEKSVLGESIKKYLDSFFNEVFGAWVPVVTDGGLALKTLYTTWSVSHNLDNYLSDNIKNG